MTDQFELDMDDLIVPTYDEQMTLGERFAAFHDLNPHIYRLLERMASQWIASGRTRFGIGMAFEVLRYRSGVETIHDVYRLNNNFRSRYARMLIEAHPEWAACIETRQLKAA